MSTKSELPQRQPRRRSRSLLFILLTLLAIIIVALAVGLGVGLTRRQKNDSNSTSNSNNNTDAGSSSDPNSNSSSLIFPMGNVTSIVPYTDGVWQPPVNASWQIVLKSPITVDLKSNYTIPNVDVWDIDMFGNKRETVDHLHKIGKRVICYFSAGSYEPNRPDSNDFLPSDKGNALIGWEDENWLNLNSENVRKIMAKRVKYAYDMGCDAIDPDNVDGFNNENGIGITKQDSINFIKFLYETAKPYNLAVGLKNAGEIIPDVIEYTAFQINEQCAEKKECKAFQGFIDAKKPVFHIEYPKGDTTNNYNTATGTKVDNLCKNQGANSNTYDFSTVVKNMNLDGWVQYCGGQTAVTPCQGSGSKTYG